jgi:BirA family biotin operon repressor/biotin-[acetyl-CoA-carboxylase] ligase
MSDELPADLAQALDRTRARRGRFGEPAYYFSEIGSTNDIASSLAGNGAPEGAMVVASAQTAGRGRLGRQWHSPLGAGLYVSLVFRSPQVTPWLTLTGGVAVASGITRGTGLPVEIKWPNDVVVSGSAAAAKRRKLAGILAEATSGPGGVLHVVLGFGINLKAAAYPIELADRATSIEVELGREVDGAAVLVETLAGMAECVGALEAGDVALVLDRWRDLAPSTRGAQV